jgi:FixJ family two-component response regulator
MKECSKCADEDESYRSSRAPAHDQARGFRGRVMAEKILFVDDEPPVLDGLKRMLHREFEVDTAVGGEQALKTMGTLGPYAVVISDMRMPGMNGAQLLAQVRQTAPETVRMLLTGHTDLNAAIEAVNEGNIFRFLTKPCEKEVLAKALTTGLVQHRLITAEKELLEHTLMGSIKVLTEVLSAASPEAFGRSMRITRCVRHLVGRFGLPALWRFEAAAMLSQLGCVTLDAGIIQAAYAGQELSPDDQARFAAHPLVARDLLVNIPRLEPVAWMISQQFKETPTTIPEIPGTSSEGIVFGAKMLKLAVAFDNQRLKGLSDEQAITNLRGRKEEFGADLVEALSGIKPDTAKTEVRKVPASKLTAGMVLQQEIRTRTGMLVVAKGQEISHALLIKLENFSRAGTIDKEIMVLVPIEARAG